MASEPNTNEETIKLTPAQTEMVREALKAKEEGEPSFTAEEVLEHARAKVKKWLPSQSA